MFLVTFFFPKHRSCRDIEDFLHIALRINGTVLIAYIYHKNQPNVGKYLEDHPN